MTKKLFKIWSELKTIDDKESILKCFKRRKNKNLYFVFKKNATNKRGIFF